MTKQTPQIQIAPLDDNSCIVELHGDWQRTNLPPNAMLLDTPRISGKFSQFQIHLQNLDSCDSFGALTLKNTLEPMMAANASFVFEQTNASAPLIEKILQSGPFPSPIAPAKPQLSDVPAGIGKTMNMVSTDIWRGVDMLGSFLMSARQSILDFKNLRSAPYIFQLDRVAVQGLPIVVLMSAIVGAIVAQQGIFQLEKFGASVFAIDLLGILIFRELGVLLTAIMVAGRSGSAFTAELGSMKMNEEIDALRVLGLDPIKVLVMPRLFALIVGLPLLNIASALAALVGGAFVCIIYGDISFALYLERLREAIALNTFLVGMIKAPFLALVIGIIAVVEGFSVKGSSESLGGHTTASVVKAIFSVIVLDGLFAMFFAAIQY